MDVDSALQQRADISLVIWSYFLVPALVSSCAHLSAFTLHLFASVRARILVTVAWPI